MDVVWDTAPTLERRITLANAARLRHFPIWAPSSRGSGKVHDQCVLVEFWHIFKRAIRFTDRLCLDLSKV